MGGIPENAKIGAEGVDMEQADRVLKEHRDEDLMMGCDDEDEEHEDEEEEGEYEDYD